MSCPSCLYGPCSHDEALVPANQALRDLVKREFNSPAVLGIELSPPVVGVPAYPARARQVFRCVGCGTEGTLASPVGWVCDCDCAPKLVDTGRVEWR